MKVKELIEHLLMFGEDTEVFIQTTPHDLCAPITRRQISIINGSISDLYGFEPHKLLLTAHIKQGD